MRLNTLNAEFHSLRYERPGSPLLVELIGRFCEAYPWRTVSVMPGLVKSSQRQHAKMMAAIRAGQAALPADLMRVHIEGSRAFIVEGLPVANFESVEGSV